MADKCYTCRFCKINSHGSIYCSLREKGGKCYDHDGWESQEDVLDKIRDEIFNKYPEHQCTGELTGYADAIDDVLEIIDKYKAESEE